MARPLDRIDVEAMRGGPLNRVAPSLGDEQGNRGPPNGAGAGPAAAAAAEQDPFDFDDAEAEGADVPANPPPPLDAASALMRGPPIPADSEPHIVKYRGRTVVKCSEDNPPDGRTCSTVVQFLRGLNRRKRSNFVGNAAEGQEVVVTAARGSVSCKPIPAQNAPLPSGLRISLLHITTVADIAEDVCIVTGRVRPGSTTVTFFAYVFTTESPFAARYLVEQVVQACRYAFMIGRMQQAQQAQRREAELAARAARGSLPSNPTNRAQPSPRPAAATTTPAAEEIATPAPPRAINEQDRTFYSEYRKLHETLARYERQWLEPQLEEPGPVPTRIASVDRGDGLWYTCCQSLGKCSCHR